MIKIFKVYSMVEPSRTRVWYMYMYESYYTRTVYHLWYKFIFFTLLKEAVLYVQQGLDNEKFMKTVPPTSYKILHHPLCYWLIFFATLALLLLAISERPSSEPTKADKACSEYAFRRPTTCSGISSTCTMISRNCIM